MRFLWTRENCHTWRDQVIAPFHNRVALASDEVKHLFSFTGENRVQPENRTTQSMMKVVLHVSTFAALHACSARPKPQKQPARALTSGQGGCTSVPFFEIYFDLQAFIG